MIIVKLYIIMLIVNIFLNAILTLMRELGYDFSFLDTGEPVPEEPENKEIIIFMTAVTPLIHIYNAASYLAIMTIAIVYSRKEK